MFTNYDSVVFSFDLNINSNINAHDIDAWNIYAFNIIANNIIYYAVCVAYKNIKCKSIKGIIEGAKHFVLDKKIGVLGNE